MRKRSFGGLLIVALLMVPTSHAFAHGSATPAVSCVDVGNDGHCDAGDPPLAPLVADGHFNAAEAEPGWTPRKTPVGVVLDGFVISGDVDITVDGDAHLLHKVLSQHRGLALRVNAANVDVAPKAEVRVGDTLSLVATSTVHVGAGAFVMVPGNDAPGLTVTGNIVKLDDNARLATGGMESPLYLTANVTLTLGTGVQFATAPRGWLDITANSDIVATGVRVRAGKIDINSLWSIAGSHRVISLTNSTVSNTYTNSQINMYAGPARHGAHAPGDAIHFVHSRVSSHAMGQAFFDPAPN